VLDLAGHLGWPVLADPRSGCRLPHDRVVAHFDAILRSAAGRAARPETVLRFGSLPASKVLTEWLHDQAGEQIGIDADGRRSDPLGDLGPVVVAPAGEVGPALMRSCPGGTDPAWGSRWADADRRAASAIDLALSDRLTDPAVARRLVARLPDGAHLVVSSSMPVRDVEWYAAPRSGVRVLANRGANGIDGVVSTAVGVALAGAPTVALVGDVAFLHDTNALLGLTDRGVDLTVVVVDNDGGAIFSFLPQARVLDDVTYERLFGTPHGLDLVAVARAHGVDAASISDADGLDAELRREVAGPRVVVVHTDRGANVAVHDEIHQAVADALDR
jgi:2-succinyl-5-enolpyruvyl-6-hydroxy-3-cyclohexene-1-carboxylate synthase